jgi:hypothetical protein
LVEETTDLVKVTDKLYHIMFQVHLAEAGFERTTLVEIGTNCTGSCKSNYHTITTTTTPLFKLDKHNILKPVIIQQAPYYKTTPTKNHPLNILL